MTEREKRYTPGPWRLGRGHKTGTPRTVMPVLRRDSLIRSQNYEANAHLIAAAPDLLEALESIQAWVTDEGFEDTHEGVAEICAQARAAIAKAHGETP